MENAQVPTARDLIDMPVEAETILVCGAELPFGEFTMAVRELWRDHAEKHDWHGVTKRFLALQSKVQELFSSPKRIEVQEKLVETLELQLDNKMAGLKPGRLTADVRLQLNDMADLIDEERARLKEMRDPHTLSAFDDSKDMDAALEGIRAEKREVQMRFAHRLAVLHGETRSYEAFSEGATGSDYAAAEELLNEGNASWGVQAAPLNRAQRRAKSKARN